MLLLLLSLPLLPLQPAAATGGTIERSDPALRKAKEAELLQLRKNIASLRKELGQVRSRHDALREELRQVEQSVAHITAELRQLDAQLASHDRQLVQLQERNQTLLSGLATQRTQLRQQIRAAYLAGKQEYLKILLNQENPAAVGRALAYYDYFNRARSERITTLQSTLDELVSVRSRMEESQRTLVALRSRQQQQKQALEKTRGNRRTVLAELGRELDTKDRQLQSLLADEKALEKLLLNLTRIMADIPAETSAGKPFAQLRGKLPWPVSGKILESFGSQRMGSLRWQGVLLNAGEDTPVKAVAHGRVAFADWMRGYGYLLILDHGNGYMSLYGNNQSLDKGVGDWVKAGETVARSGSSGGTTRDGVYFEIRHKGKPQDPVRWCRR